MIALDANTALRPFRDIVWDLREFANALPALANDNTLVYIKYADGRVMPFASASLIHSLFSSFTYLNLNGVGIVPGEALKLQNMSEKAQQIRAILPTVTDPDFKRALELTLHVLDDIGLQAEVDGGVLRGPDVVPITKSHIGTLRVENEVHADDASKGLEGKTLITCTGGFLSGNEGRISNVTVNRLENTESSQHAFETINVSELHYPVNTNPLYVSRPNKLPSAMNGTAFMGTVGLEARVCEKIELTDTMIHLNWAPLHSSQVSGTGVFEYCIPISENGQVTYYPVEGISRNYTDQGSDTLAPYGMNVLLLWPAWELTGTVRNDVYARATSTQWRAKVIDNSPALPIVVVTNATNKFLTPIANAWKFEQDNGKGKMTVLNTITIAPYTSVEFLFSYNGQTNAAYMFPSRAL